MLWDTGVPMPCSLGPSNEPNAWKRKSTLLDETRRGLSVKPADIRYVAFAFRTRTDMATSSCFPRRRFSFKRLEYEWPNQDGSPRYSAGRHPVKKIEGDSDIFGDGSATLLATPGHTPGQSKSLLVKLPEDWWWCCYLATPCNLNENWDAKRCIH